MSITYISYSIGMVLDPQASAFLELGKTANLPDISEQDATVAAVIRLHTLTQVGK